MLKYDFLSLKLLESTDKMSFEAQIEQNNLLLTGYTLTH